MRISGKYSLSTMLLTAALTSACHMAVAQDGIELNEIRRIHNIVWEKAADKPFTPMPATSIPANQANLVFVRPIDNRDIQSSANIAIDERFQVSLQGGHYSQRLGCAGWHDISVAVTGIKSNDLGLNETRVQVQPQQNHYFYVTLDTPTQPRILEITEASALEVLKNSREQTHQISRVVADCAPVQPMPIVVMPEPIMVVNPQPTVEVIQEMPVVETVQLNQPIKLDLHFAFDSSKINSAENNKVSMVADYLRQYPSTTAWIQGHTDSVGSAKYNQGLSERRAYAVKNLLVQKYGSDPQRITTVGYGETQPIDTNATYEGRKNNRRVVAIISDQ